MKTLIFSGKVLVLLGLIIGLVIGFDSPAAENSAGPDSAGQTQQGTQAPSIAVAGQNLPLQEDSDDAAPHNALSTSSFVLPDMLAGAGLSVPGLSQLWADPVAAVNALSSGALEWGFPMTSLFSERNRSGFAGEMSWGDSALALGSADSFKWNNPSSLGYNGSTGSGLLPDVGINPPLNNGDDPFENSNGGLPRGTEGIDVSPVPLPGAIWLFGSGLAGFGFISRKKHRA